MSEGISHVEEAFPNQQFDVFDCRKRRRHADGAPPHAIHIDTEQLERDMYNLAKKAVRKTTSNDEASGVVLVALGGGRITPQEARALERIRRDFNLTHKARQSFDRVLKAAHEAEAPEEKSVPRKKRRAPS